MKELQKSLTRGYQTHVLGQTLYSILRGLSTVHRKHSSSSSSSSHGHHDDDGAAAANERNNRRNSSDSDSQCRVEVGDLDYCVPLLNEVCVMLCLEDTILVHVQVHV
jgi:hypothetical protein